MAVGKLSTTEYMMKTGHQTIVPHGKTDRHWSQADKNTVLALGAKHTLQTKKGTKRISWANVLNDWNAQVEKEKTTNMADRIRAFAGTKDQPNQKSLLCSLHQRLILEAAVAQPQHKDDEASDDDMAIENALVQVADDKASDKKEKKAGKKRKLSVTQNAPPPGQPQLLLVPPRPTPSAAMNGMDGAALLALMNSLMQQQQAQFQAVLAQVQAPGPAPKRQRKE